MYPDYLAHYGVKGMKWGVRRYQNPDGSLTKAGMSRYGSMSNKKLYKTLKKQVRDARSQQYGSGNRWMRRLGIGENSKKLISEYEKNEKEYLNSPEHKKAESNFEKRVKKLDDLYENGKITVDEYDRGYKEATSQFHKEIPNKTYKEIYSSYAIMGSGRKYFVKNFLTEGGKDLSKAYLKDLGYNDKVSENFVNRLIKDGKTLAMD